MTAIATKKEAPGGNPTLTTTAPLYEEKNELSEVTIPAATDIDAEQREWLHSTVGSLTLDSKKVREYFAVAGEGLRVTTLEGAEEVAFPLVVHARELQYKSMVCLQRDNDEQPWDVCAWTAGEGVMTPEEARDYGAQLGRAASLAERLNGLAAI